MLRVYKTVLNTLPNQFHRKFSSYDLIWQQSMLHVSAKYNTDRVIDSTCHIHNSQHSYRSIFTKDRISTLGSHLAANAANRTLRTPFYFSNIPASSPVTNPDLYFRGIFQIYLSAAFSSGAKD